MSKLREILLVLLLTSLSLVDGHDYALHSRCSYSSEDASDVVMLDEFIFNQLTVIRYNSTVGKFEGYTELGISNAERWNNDPAHLASQKAAVETFCKNNAKIYYQTVYTKTVEPQIEVTLVKQSDGPHPARLMCSAYNFYPPQIQVTWLRDGKEVEGGVTSTEEMANGDWYYQIHSHLEFIPKSGEEITCVVQHASSPKPFVYKWDPSMPKGDRSKFAVGASVLVLGIILLAAGLIMYCKKKSSGRIQVPT